MQRVFGQFSDTQRSGNPWRRLLGLLCVGLIVFAGTLSVTHSHPHGAADHDGCSLCATAHAVAQAATAPVAVLAITVFTTVDRVFPVGRARTFQGLAHTIRPPPAALDRADARRLA